MCIRDRVACQGRRQGIHWATELRSEGTVKRRLERRNRAVSQACIQRSTA
jgi:hypothetical protein